MDSLRRKLIWLVTSRAAIIAVIFGITILMGRESPLVVPVTILLLIVSLLSLIYAVALKAHLSPTFIFPLQLANDTLLVTWLVYSTGDVESPFKVLYLIIIFSGSLLPSRRGVPALLLGSIALFATITGLVLTGQIDRATGYPSYGPEDLSQLQYNFAVSVLGMIAVALFSSSLVDRLLKTDLELAQAARRLADLRAFNERIIESMRTGLISADLDGRIVTYNRAAEEIMGNPAADVVGRSISDFFGDIASIGLNFQDEERPVRIMRSDSVYLRPDGAEVHLGFNVAPLKAESGETKGVVLIFQDLTEVFKLEQEVRRQEKLAAIGAMAAGLAHEIRNPLASIRGSIQVLVGELDLDEDQHRLMQIMLRESERLNRIVADFLSFARPSPLNAHEFDLRRMLSDAVLLLRNSPEVKPTQEIVEAYADEPAMFVSDANRIRQVFWNLARNALKAMPDGGKLTVRLESGQKGSFYLSIEDDGVGIDADQMNKLFVPFSSSSPSGTGLGMAIVYQIVTEHGGQIEVNSAPGKGTIVRIWLPPLSRKVDPLQVDAMNRSANARDVGEPVDARPRRIV